MKAVPYAERAAKAVPVETKRTRIVLSAYKKTGDMYRDYNNIDPAVLAAHGQINLMFLETLSEVVTLRNKRLVQAGESLPGAMTWARAYIKEGVLWMDIGKGTVVNITVGR